MSTTTRRDETGLDTLNTELNPARDASHFRAVIVANDAVVAAEAALRAAVREARNAGDSWVVIGAALGVTKQAAQQRFSQD